MEIYYSDFFFLSSLLERSTVCARSSAPPPPSLPLNLQTMLPPSQLKRIFPFSQLALYTINL